MMSIYEQISELLKKGESIYVITVVSKSGHAPSEPGSKMIVLENGDIFGTIGGGSLEDLAYKKALSSFKKPGSFILRYRLDNEIAEEYKPGSTEERQLDIPEIKTGMICGGMITLFFEYIPPSLSLCIFGSGHIGRALVLQMKQLGFSITVIDDREEIITHFPEGCRTILTNFNEVFQKNPELKNSRYFIITSNSHTTDEECLKQIYLHVPNILYIGMIASSNKAKIIQHKVSDFIQKEKGKQPDFSVLYSPAGLNIGGRFPEEIAVSLIAEIQSIRYGINEIVHLKDLKKK